MDDQTIFDYIEGTLTTEQKVDVEQHLERSASLRNELALWQASKLQMPKTIAFPAGKIIHKSWWQAFPEIKWFSGTVLVVVFVILVYQSQRGPESPVSNATDTGINREQAVISTNADFAQVTIAESTVEEIDASTAHLMEPLATQLPRSAQAGKELSIMAIAITTGTNYEKAVLGPMTGMTLYRKPSLQGYNHQVIIPPFKNSENTSKAAKSKLQWGKPHVESSGF